MDVDECASSPCQNGGACFNGAGYYSCNCTGGWSGGNCTRQPACLSSPCQHGGRCDDRMEVRQTEQAPLLPPSRGRRSAHSLRRATALQGVEPVFSCACNVGWRGVVCEHHICDAVGAPSPCENGGQCIPVAASSQPSTATDSLSAAAAAFHTVDQRRRAAAGVFGAANAGFVCNCTSEWGGARCTNAPQPCTYPSAEDCAAVAWLLKAGCSQHEE